MESNTVSNREKKNKEQPLLELSREEKKRCVFECVNQNYRLFECVVHKNEKASHGLRLHPPHLWEVKDGVPYKRVGDDLVVWYELNSDK
jgi:hypothetical protein